MDIKELKITRNPASKINHPWEHARSRVIFDILKPYIKHHSLSLNVLDIGCGDLFFLDQFCRQFAPYHPAAAAIDTAFDDTLIAFLKKKHQDLPIDICKNFQNLKFNDGHVDIIFLLDVIEHIENSQDFLEFLLRQAYIDKNTLFVITVPAFNNLFFKHDQWLGHYRRYSQEELKRTVEDAGFQYIKGGYFFFTLLLARFIQKHMDTLLIKKDDNMKGIGDWHHGKIFSFLCEMFLLGDYHTAKLFLSMGITIPGLSTYILCKPQS